MATRNVNQRNQETTRPGAEQAHDLQLLHRLRAISPGISRRMLSSAVLPMRAHFRFLILIEVNFWFSIDYLFFRRNFVNWRNKIMGIFRFWVNKLMCINPYSFN